jgi:hypothetical protein
MDMDGNDRYTGPEASHAIPAVTESTAGMADDPRLEQAFALIRAVIADADKRAASDLVARISGTVTVPGSRGGGLFGNNIDEQPDKRAPRGSAAILIDRALSEAGEKGLTVIGIQSKAETDFEHRRKADPLVLRRSRSSRIRQKTFRN